MTQPPRSQRFDDVYFSAENGMEETRHVFVEGNDLPRRWQDRADFTIAETGFGTGLNFLVAWKLFTETAPAGAFLDFISVEKYPLSPEEIRVGLSHWLPELGRFLDKMLEQYPLRTAGYHRMVFDGRVALTLIFDDVNAALPTLDAEVDCWFLDGFTPAKNPSMWTQDVFNEMARLSAPGATFATFTAAGDVKRGLRAAGFDVVKQKGFGRKRDMLAGALSGKDNVPSRLRRRSASVAILGGGLAGSACAYVLRQYGFSPVLYERASSLGEGASGNALGLYNPRFTAMRGPESDFYSPAFAMARRTLDRFDGIDFNPCGALHFLIDSDKAERLRKTSENWGWHEDHMQMLCADQVSAIAGLPLEQEALYLPDSGSVSPAALCAAYAQNVDVHFNANVKAEDVTEDLIVLAGGPDLVGKYEDIPLETVRGQVSYLEPSAVFSTLKTALCYGGYVVPDKKGGAVCGATFQPWLDDSVIRADDHATNIGKLAQYVPSMADAVAYDGRAALRTASKDRFPVIGALDTRTFITTAHGSHGIISSLMGAHLIADQLRGGPFCLPRHTVNALAPQRFSQRKRKAG